MLLALAAARAAAISAVDIPTGLLALASLLAALTALWRSRAREGELRHRGDGRWTWRRDAEISTGRLVDKGFHGRWCIVLVLQADDGRERRVLVWRDALAAQDYAFLHLVIRTGALFDIN